MSKAQEINAARLRSLPESATLADLRLSRSMSQRAASKAIGVSQPHVCRIERDGTNNFAVITNMIVAYGYDQQMVMAAIARTREKALDNVGDM